MRRCPATASASAITVVSWRWTIQPTRPPCCAPSARPTNVSLPDPLRQFVERQVETGGYGTSSEYVRELIRRDQDRLQLRSLLLAGAKSRVTGETDAAYFAKLRSRAAKKPRARKATA